MALPEQLNAIANGELTRPADVAIGAQDEGLLRGDGVFEVIRLYAGRPFALDEHLERMSRSAQRLRLPFSADVLARDVALLLSSTAPVDGALRLLVTRGGFRLAVVEAIAPLPASLALATVTYHPTGILDGVKSLSYAGNMLARRLAAERGADDALLVRPDGRVLEGPTSAFFYVRSGRLHTPPLTGGILESITRRHLLALGEATERSIEAAELCLVEEAFLASSLREVHPVHRLDEHALPGVDGPVTSAVAGAMRAHVEGALESS